MLTQRRKLTRLERRKFWRVSDRKWRREHPEHRCQTAEEARRNECYLKLSAAYWDSHDRFDALSGMAAWLDATRPDHFFGVLR